MLPVKLNTYVQHSKTVFIDPLSKCYIIGESLLGLNRLPVILKGRRYCLLTSTVLFVYSLALSICIFYVTYRPALGDNILLWFVFCIEYTLNVLLSFFCSKRIERFYNELNKFDEELACRPTTTKESFRHFIVIIVFLACLLLFNIYLGVYIQPYAANPMVAWILLCLTHCLEASFYGHLLSLIVPRLRLISYFTQGRFGKSIVRRPHVQKLLTFKNKTESNYDFIKLMDVYHIMTDAYDLLIDAIKWQMLVTLIGSFMYAISACYDMSMRLMHNEVYSSLDAVVTIFSFTMVLLPVFSPCTFGDLVHNEVRRLRELIACRLYENKLDKSARGTARALLSLTEVRDFSFSLLQMVQVDISLPFKFVGLLVTYLIILLQFDKVIHPTTPTASPQLNNVTFNGNYL